MHVYYPYVYYPQSDTVSGQRAPDPTRLARFSEAGRVSGRVNTLGAAAEAWVTRLSSAQSGSIGATHILTLSSIEVGVPHDHRWWRRETHHCHTHWKQHMSLKATRQS
jgi:hypothetical protein